MKSHFKVIRERMKEEALLAVFFSLSHAHAHAPKDERTSGERLLSPLLLFFDDDIYSEDVLKVQKGEIRFPECLGS